MADKQTFVDGLTALNEDVSPDKTARSSAETFGDLLEAFVLSIKVKPGITVSGATSSGDTLVEAVTDSEGEVE